MSSQAFKRARRGDGGIAIEKRSPPQPQRANSRKVAKFEVGVGSPRVAIKPDCSRPAECRPVGSQNPVPPSPALVALGRLRRLADRLLEHEDGDAGWFKAALMVYEAGAGDGVTLDRAFGLAPTPGHEGWWTSEARTRRDALLCEIAARFYADEPSERRQAEKIAQRLARFHSGARLWRPGTIEELLHYLRPTSARTVRRTLAAGQPLPTVAGPEGGVPQRDVEAKAAAADC
jgi:hypothetical protein